MTKVQGVVCILLTVLYTATVVNAMLTGNSELAGIMTPVILVPIGFLFGRGLFSIEVKKRPDEG